MIKAGIIGFGYMGMFHLNRIREVKGIEVKSAYDISDEALLFAEKENLVTYKNLKEFLDDEEISLVIICTPNDSHAELAMQSLNAGKHVLCEKPATLNVAELQAVLDSSKNNNRIFTTHQNRRWDSDYQVIKKTVDEGLIGGIHTIYSATYGQRGVCFGWRASKDKGGGMLYDWGIHFIDQILMLFPEYPVTGVYAKLRSILTPEVDDYFELQLDFANIDMVAHISVATFALQDLPRWFLFGDKGSLKLEDFSGIRGGAARIKTNIRGFERVKENSVQGPTRTMAHLERECYEDLELFRPEDQHLLFYENLIDALNGEKDIIVTPEQIMRDMKVLESAFLSNQRGQVLATKI